MTASADEMIRQLRLEPLPREGGFFRVTWKTKGTSVPSAASAIYFLITSGDFSALHRLTCEEIWCHHAGDAAEQWQLDPTSGSARVILMGSELASEQLPQAVVLPGIWQGTRLVPGGKFGWALFTCFVTPAWDESAFTLGERAALSAQFPGVAKIICALTR